MPRPCGTVPLRCPSRSARANKGEEEGEGEGGAPCPLSLPSPATFFSFTASQTLSHPRRPATRGFPAARGPHLIRTFLRIPFLPPCLLSSPLCFASAPHPIPHPDPKPPHAYILLRFASTLLTPTSSQALPQPPASPLSSLPYAAPRRAGKHFFLLASDERTQ